MLFERSFETGRISVIKGSRQGLVKVVFFQLRGHGYPQDDATPNFFANSKRPILGLLNEISFVTKILEKVVKIKETSFHLSKCLVSIAHHCTSTTGRKKPNMMMMMMAMASHGQTIPSGVCV